MNLGMKNKKEEEENTGKKKKDLVPNNPLLMRCPLFSQFTINT